MVSPFAGGHPAEPKTGARRKDLGGIVLEK
jgi:hypothetical protein